jgi:pseudouridine synthase
VRAAHPRDVATTATRTGRQPLSALEDTERNRRSDTTEPPAAAPHSQGDRLQKVLAHAGIASRRHAESLMRLGRVTVNGAVVSELGTRVDPLRDLVCVDGRAIRQAQPSLTVLLNKPAGPVTTVADPQGRQTVLDLLPLALRERRLYPIGRLDRDTEGLLLLTDDGDLALRLTHPRYALPKVYEALVEGEPAPATLRLLENGIQLPGDQRPTAPARIWQIGRQGEHSWIGLELHEGRNRQVRRMLESVGHRVLQLRRARVGPLELGSLPVGAWRVLTDQELRALRLATSGATPV